MSIVLIIRLETTVIYGKLQLLSNVNYRVLYSKTNKGENLFSFRQLSNSRTIEHLIMKMSKNNMFYMYEKFLAINFWSPRTSLDINSSSSLVSKTKLLAIVVIRLLCFVFMIRAAIAITLPKSMTKNIICEYFQFYGNPTPIHIGLLSGAICANLCAYPLQYMLFNGKSKIFRFLFKIKTSCLRYNLNKASLRKFKIRLQVISLLCLLFTVYSILAIIYLSIGIIVVYLKEDYKLLGNYQKQIRLTLSSTFTSM